MKASGNVFWTSLSSGKVAIISVKGRTAILIFHLRYQNIWGPDTQECLLTLANFLLLQTEMGGGGPPYELCFKLVNWLIEELLTNTLNSPKTHNCLTVLLSSSC